MSPHPSEQPRQFDPERELAFVQAVLARQEMALVSFEWRMRCVPRILGALNRRRGRPLGEHDLADLVQDTTLIALRKLGEFEAHSELEGWLYRLCHLEFLNAIRRRGRQQRRTDELPDDFGDPAQASHHQHDDVYRALDKLGGVEAETIRMKHFEGLTFQEIGDRLGMPANTAKTRYYRGLSQLEGILRTLRRREEDA